MYQGTLSRRNRGNVEFLLHLLESRRLRRDSRRYTSVFLDCCIPLRLQEPHHIRCRCPNSTSRTVSLSSSCRRLRVARIYGFGHSIIVALCCDSLTQLTFARKTTRQRRVNTILLYRKKDEWKVLSSCSVSHARESPKTPQSSCSRGVALAGLISARVDLDRALPVNFARSCIKPRRIVFTQCLLRVFETVLGNCRTQLRD